ncbi:MAG: capsule assembly Wzi family protein [Candidatus Rariloculaceae bacterium]
MNKGLLHISALFAIVFLSHKLALGEPWLSPGDMVMRNDLQLLSDAGLLQVPLTTWPISLANVDAALEDIDHIESDSIVGQSLTRVRNRLSEESRSNDIAITSSVRASSKEQMARTFEDTPRAKAELGGGISWMGRRFAINLQGHRASNPLDKETFRLDGSYFGAVVGNWMLAFGYPERWWGPGWDGSLILSTNARPSPQFSIQRNITKPFNSRWLSWIGPWSLTSFISQLNDNRFVEDAMLTGLRMTATPVPGLEIGLSRSAQLCGTGRPCRTRTFLDLLLGQDNPGINVAADREPGNQLGGMDMRWASPVGDLPYALYLQWIGEDTRQGGPEIGSWLRQLGVDFWGAGPRPGWQHRTHIEVTDTMCQEGGIGFGGEKPNCAYEHHQYRTGYRYQGRSIGHGIDSDSLSSSIGSTLTDPNGNSMNFLARHMEINRDEKYNSLSSVGQEITEFSVSYNRRITLGTASIGLAYSFFKKGMVSANTNNNIEWWIAFQTN